MPSRSPSAFTTPVNKTAPSFPEKAGPIKPCAGPTNAEKMRRNLEIKKNRTARDNRTLDLLNNPLAESFATAIAELEDTLACNSVDLNPFIQNESDPENKLIHYYLCCCTNIPTDTISLVISALEKSQSMGIAEISRTDTIQFEDILEEEQKEQQFEDILKEEEQKEQQQAQYHANTIIQLKDRLKNQIKTSVILLYLRKIPDSLQSSFYMASYIEQKTDLLLRNILKNFLDTQTKLTSKNIDAVLRLIRAEIKYKKFTLDEKQRAFVDFFKITNVNGIWTYSNQPSPPSTPLAASSF